MSEIAEQPARRLAGAIRRVLSSVERGLRAAFAPVQLPGWLVLGTGTICLAIAYPLGWVEFAVPGTVMISLFVIAALFAAGRSAYSITVDMADQRVTVGQVAAGSFTVRNTARHRLLPARIELPVGRSVTSFSLPSLGSGATHEGSFVIPTNRRSVVKVGPIRSARGDAFGLIIRRVEWTRPVELFVHPQTTALTGATAGVLRDLEGQESGVICNDDMSFHALREYVPGDDRRNIHWKSTARVGTLMVRQFDDTRRTSTGLGLSTDLNEYRSDADAELAVSAFASLGVQALFDERELNAVAGDGNITSVNPPRLLDGCAALLLRTNAASFSSVARRVARTATRASIIFLVTGGIPGPQGLRHATMVFPPGLRVVTFSCEMDTALEVRNQGSLTQVRLGQLSDLPRALRNAVAG